MPALLADADACCGGCSSSWGCLYGLAGCPCHQGRGVIETSLRDLNAAAREVPYDRFTTPEWDE